jgi:hypothetical protein
MTFVAKPFDLKTSTIRPSIEHDIVMNVEGCVLTAEGAAANFFTEYKHLCDARWAEKAFAKKGPQVFLANRLGAPSKTFRGLSIWLGDALAISAATNKGVTITFFTDCAPELWRKEWAALYHACTGRTSSWVPAPMPAWVFQI